MEFQCSQDKTFWPQLKTDQFVILVRKFDNPTMSEQSAPIGNNINSTPFSDNNDWAQLAGLWHDLGK